MTRYAYQPFEYVTPLELEGGARRHVPVVIVGAGPVGLAAAIDLALHGVPSIVLDENNVVSVGSRAICWSKRTLEIFDRLGVGDRMLAKGVTWQIGRLFHHDQEVYGFDLLPEPGHKMPAFINLQQYYVEQYLVERCADFADLIDLRWKNTVTSVAHKGETVEVDVETPDGRYVLTGDFLLACDGARSTVRQLLALEFSGTSFDERFLISDVEMTADFPSERWFWFEPPFHNGRSALLHKQPDNIYRIDLQLGPDADPDEEKKPENVIPRIKAMVGDRPFELDWVSVYTFRCARLESFVHDRIIFAGDSAHIVSPFGARGGNGGIQDVDNLCWKLAAVLSGDAPKALLQTYNDERVAAADENILNSARATSFMTPKTPLERRFRDCVLTLAADLEFARGLVNSGRLSKPCSYPDVNAQPGAGASMPAMTRPGAPAVDLPMGKDWLLQHLGNRFSLLHIGLPAADASDVGQLSVGQVSLDACDFAQERYLGDAVQAIYLVRPDQHIAARWDRLDMEAVSKALDTACARS